MSFESFKSWAWCAFWLWLVAYDFFNVPIKPEDEDDERNVDS